MMKGKTEDSGIFKIRNIPENPFLLFSKWYQERQVKNIGTNVLCLSTATKDGKVSARNVVLRRLDEDGFVIMTDCRSKKVAEMRENPYVAMTFLWVQEVNDGDLQVRQARAEGIIKELPIDDWIDIYDREPLYCKIRAYVCHQGQNVEWDDLKEHHDELHNLFVEGSHTLERPDHVRAFKMDPSMIEFYETEGDQIADRVMYLKEEDEWRMTRIAA
ncbi:hypothetical protein O3M35_000552 [Rhynocoris fuscipes]|uniref:pyridoxal 5'-phosphate synthase n=1 Tax=Rhynocoris fuscipes TaxID=488301 RepID=A0AAW1DNW6_9HEMI